MELRRYFVQTSPRTHLYEFIDGQDHVRLVIASDNDVCATVSVQNNSVSRVSSSSYIALRYVLSINLKKSNCVLFGFSIKFLFYISTYFNCFGIYLILN